MLNPIKPIPRLMQQNTKVGLIVHACVGMNCFKPKDLNILPSNIGISRLRPTLPFATEEKKTAT